MSTDTTFLTPELHQYLLNVSATEPEVMQHLRRDTQNIFKSHKKQTPPEQARLIYLLVKILNAQFTLDVGTFTGVSALTAAMALPLNGKVVACEIDPKPLELATKYWEKANVATKIELRLGAARDTLNNLLTEQSGKFDFAYIDADKGAIGEYYEMCLQLIRSGGLVAIDNVLWHGRVIDHTNTSKSTESIRKFNQMLCRDKRIDMSLIPIGDGMSIARKK